LKTSPIYNDQPGNERLGDAIYTENYMLEHWNELSRLQCWNIFQSRIKKWQVWESLPDNLKHQYSELKPWAPKYNKPGDKSIFLWIVSPLISVEWDDKEINIVKKHTAIKVLKAKLK
jgi:hypothetical protein